MYRLTKHLSVDNGSNVLRFVCCMLGLIGMCCSFTALADPLSGSVEELAEPLALLDDQDKTMTDIDLSVINGKGWELTTLDGNERLAVILWDERGNDNRPTINSNASAGQSGQSVLVTYNR